MRHTVLILAAPLLVAVAACSGSTTTRMGDLGRPVDLVQTGAVPDRYVVEPGTRNFNRTTEEERMADRLWRFLHAPHVSGWFIPRLPAAGSAGSDDTGRYYRWLQKVNYRAPEVRYSTVAGDVYADLQTLPGAFEAICAVEEIDRQRGVALAQLGPLEPGMADRVNQRRAENEASVASFVAAVRYRYESYNYALDNLLVETPSEKARDVDRQLVTLSGYVARAEAGAFCSRPATGPVIVK